MPLCAALLFIGSDFDSMHPDNRMVKYKSGITAEINKGGDGIRQSFVCKPDKISGLEVTVDTFARQNNKGELIIELIEEITDRSLRTVRLDVRQLKNGSANRIHFLEITGVKDKNLAIIIKSTSPAGKGVALYTNVGDSKTGKLLVNGNKQIAESIKFDLRRNISALTFLDRVTQFKPDFIKGRLFYIITGLFVFGVVFIMIYLISESGIALVLNDLYKMTVFSFSHSTKAVKVTLTVLLFLFLLSLVDIAVIHYTGGSDLGLSFTQISSRNISRPAFLSLFSFISIAVLLSREYSRHEH